MKKPVMELYFQTGVEKFHESMFLCFYWGIQLSDLMVNEALSTHTAHLSRQQKKFNQQLSHARVVENAFGQLKGRLKTLNVPKNISSCVVLHNICEMFGEECPDEWMVLDPPSTYHTGPH